MTWPIYRRFIEWGPVSSRPRTLNILRIESWTIHEPGILIVHMDSGAELKIEGFDAEFREKLERAIAEAAGKAPATRERKLAGAEL